MPVITMPRPGRASAAPVTGRELLRGRATQVAILAGLGALLVVSPLFRGAFFPLERLCLTAVLYALSLVGLAGAMAARGGPEVEALPRWSVLPGWVWAPGLAAAYWASLGVAVDRGEALTQALVVTGYVAAFWLAMELSRRGWARSLLWALVSAGGVTAAAGVGAAAGVVHYPSAILGGRVASTLQYPNSLASLALATLLVCSVLAAEGMSPSLWLKRRLPWTLLGALLATTLLLTYSRGAWLLFPVVVALALALVPRAFRGAVAASLGAAVFGGVVGVALAGRGLDVLPSPWVWVTVGVAEAVAAVTLWVVDRFFRRGRWTRRATLNLCIALGLVAALIMGGVLWGASRPLVLRRASSETAPRTYDIEASGLVPGETYEVEVQLAVAAGEEARAWRVLAQADGGADGVQPVMDLEGGPAPPWTVQRGTFTGPAGAGAVRLRLLNYSRGSEVSFRSIRLWPASRPTEVRELLSLARRLLPAPVLARLRALGPEEFAAQSRLVFIRDACRAWLDRPLLGAGGGAWADLYPKYRSFKYWTTEVHSYPVQVGLEAGIAGVVCLAGLAWGLIARTLRAAVKGGPEGLLANAGAAAALSLGLHGAIDFNLSLPALSLCLWVALGLVYGAPRAAMPEAPRSPAGVPSHSVAGSGPRRRLAFPRWLRPAAVLGLAVLLTLDLTVFAGKVVAERGVGLLQVGSPLEAAQALSLATALNPLAAMPHMQLALALHNAGPGERETAVRHEADRALALAAFDVKLRRAYASLAMAMGDPSLARRQLERALELCPHGEELYGDLSRLYTLTGLAQVVLGSWGRAAAEFEAVRSLEARYLKVRQSSPPDLPVSYRMAECPPVLALSLGQIACLEGQWGEGADRLQFAADLTQGKLRAEALAWLVVALQGLGRGPEWRAVRDKAVQVSADADQTVLEALQLVSAYRRAQTGGKEGE